MFWTRALCIAVAAFAALPAASATATPQFGQDEKGDSTLFLQVLSQTARPFLGASAEPGGTFGPLTAIGSPPGPSSSPPRLAVDERGGAVAAWIGEVQGDGYSYSAVLASIKPPGGEFGAPRQLSAAGNTVGELALDVNARGDAVATWVEFRDGIHYSFRTAGGSFGAEAAVPGPITHDLYTVLEADGGALFLGDDTPPTSPVAVYRRPDGSFADPTHVDGVPSLYGSVAVAGNRRGDVLLAWANGATVDVRERPAGGSFAPAREVATGVGEPGYDHNVSATMNDAGDAMLVVSSPPLSVLTRTGGGEFEKIAVPGASGAIATMAINERGQAAVAMTGNDRLVRAAYRPAGQPFDRTRVLGAVPYGVVRPAIAIDGQGTATAVWEDSDGETDTVRSRSFSHDGAGSPSTIGSVPSYLQEAPPEACVAQGQTVVAQSSRAVIARTAYATYTGCLLARGTPVDLAAPWLVPVGDFTNVQLPAAVAVAGPFAAVVVSAHGHDSFTSSWVSVIDLRDELGGQSHFGRAIGGAALDAEVPALRVTSTGAAAWVAVARPPRKRFTRTSTSGIVKYVYSLAADSNAPRLVARGKRIVPASLRLRDGRVSWRDGKRRHSVPVH